MLHANTLLVNKESTTNQTKFKVMADPGVWFSHKLRALRGHFQNIVKKLTSL